MTEAADSAVKRLEALLEAAKRGELEMFVAICAYKGGTVKTTAWCPIEFGRELLEIAVQDIGLPDRSVQ